MLHQLRLTGGCLQLVESDMHSQAELSSTVGVSEGSVDTMILLLLSFIKAHQWHFCSLCNNEMHATSKSKRCKQALQEGWD